MSKRPKSSKWAKWWRRFGTNALMSGVLFLAIGGAFWKTNSDLTEIKQRQDRIERLHKVDAPDHAAADEELTDIAASIISDLSEVVRVISPEDEKDEIEKRLVKAWQLLEESKRSPKEDHLDCRRLHTVMVEIRDKADSILHLGWGENPERAKKVALVAAPLARIQSRSGRATLIARKEYPAHPAAGGRSVKFLDAVGNVSDVMGSMHRFISLMR